MLKYFKCYKELFKYKNMLSLNKQLPSRHKMDDSLILKKRLEQKIYNLISVYPPSEINSKKGN